MAQEIVRPSFTEWSYEKHHEVREGQTVRVVDGPLTGFRGEVKEVDEQTAKVAVQVFGRVTRMDLALGQIELVPENPNVSLEAKPQVPGFKPDTQRRIPSDRRQIMTWPSGGGTGIALEWHQLTINHASRSQSMMRGCSFALGQ